MKILVPTDFSSCATHAVNTAASMAKRFKAEIHLFHVVDDFFPWNTISPDDMQINLLQLAEKKLQGIQADLMKEGITTLYFTRQGSFLKEVEYHLDSYGYDLIVMGSHGISGKSEWFIGSNTQKMIRRVHNKVLVVKDAFTGLDIKNVLYVTSLEGDDLDSFRHFVDFLQPFVVENIYMIRVNTLGYFSSPPKDFNEKSKASAAIAEGYNVKTFFYDDYSVDAGVRHFSRDNNIDLISISNHSRHNIKRIFQGSNVEIIVNHSEVPVLSIDY